MYSPGSWRANVKLRACSALWSAWNRGTAKTWKRYHRAKKTLQDAEKLFKQNQWRPALRGFRKAESEFRALGHAPWRISAASFRGRCYYWLGLLDNALFHWKTTLAENRKLGNDYGVATSLNNQGSVYRLNNEFAQSRACYEEALKIRKKTGVAADVAATLNNLGTLHESMNEYDAALRYLEQSLALNKKSKNEKDIANTLHNLGLVHDRRECYDLSIRSYNQAVALREKLGLKRELASTLTNLGMVLDATGRYSQALDCFERARQILESLPNARGMRYTLSGLGSLHNSLGQHAEALDYFQRAMGLVEESNDRPLLASLLTYRGATHHDLGHYNQALSDLEYALQLHEQHEDREQIGITLNHLANIYDELGQQEKALALYRQAMAAFTAIQKKKQIVDVRHNMGTVLAAMGRYHEALRELEHVQKVDDAGAKPRDRAYTLLNMGNVYESLGRFPESLDHHHKALTLLEKHGSPTDLGFSLTSLGRVYLATNLPEKARSCFERARVLFEKTGNPRHLAISLENLGELHLECGRSHDALEALERASVFFERIRQRITRRGEETRLRFSGFHMTQLVPLAARAALSVARDGSNREDPSVPAATAFTILERHAGAAMRDLLAERGVNPLTALPPALRERRNHLNRLLLEAQANRVPESATTDPDGHPTRPPSAATPAELDRAFTDLQEEIRRKNPEYASLVYPRALDARAVQSTLGEGELLLAFVVGKKHTFGFALTRDQIRLVDLGASWDIQTTLTLWLNDLRGTNPLGADATRYQKALSRRLVHPLEAMIQKADRITVLPTGSLACLPFETLALSSGQMIVERCPVRYVHSGTVLAALRRGARHMGAAATKKHRTLLALGNPLGPDETEPATPTAMARQGWPGRLPGSGREVQTLARLIRGPARIPPDSSRNLHLDQGPVAVFTGTHARESVLKRPEFVSAFRAVHLACHGRVDPAHPGLSGLYLTPGSSGDYEDDGYLSFHEVFNLRLNADVVVLSACDTNVGQLEGLEGVRSFARAFLHAGTPTVIVSNWKAPDTTTPVLMETFYRAWLCENLSPMEALWRAKLAVRERHAHPFHWAGFVLWGRGE